MRNSHLSSDLYITEVENEWSHRLMGEVSPEKSQLQNRTRTKRNKKVTNSAQYVN